MSRVIPWSCPRCKRRQGVDVGLRGRRFKCPACEHASRVADLDPELAKQAAELVAALFETLDDLPVRLGDALATACYRMLELRASAGPPEFDHRSFKRHARDVAFFAAFARHMPEMIDALRKIERPRHAWLYDDAANLTLDRITHRLSRPVLQLPEILRGPLKWVHPRMVRPIPGLAIALSPEGRNI